MQVHLGSPQLPVRSSPCPSSRKPARACGALLSRCPASPPSASRGDEPRSPLDCTQQTFISQMENGKPTRAALGRLQAPLVTPVENRERKRRKEEKAKKCLFFFFFKYHSGGVQPCGPSSEPQSRGALRARLAGVRDEGGTARRLPPPPRREMDRPARVCARVFVGVNAGLSGRCVRGGM